MTKPQQPESNERVIGDSGPIPEDNLPGHHPDHDQDKPSGDEFVQKLREHAREMTEPGVAVAEETPAAESSELADRAANVAGAPFRAAAKVLETVRDQLPGN